MKKAYSLFLLSFLLVGFTQFVVAQELSVQQQETIKKQVDAVFSEMVSLAEKFNYDKLTNGVDDHQQAGFIVNNHYYADYASLAEVVKAGAQGVSHQSISFSNKKITVLSDQIALLTTSGITEATLSDGRQFKVNFYWSFVYQKFGDQWKVIHSHQSRSS